MKLIEKWRARKTCHGSWWLCCQYCDTSQCNSAHDPHFVGLMLWTHAQKRDQHQPSALRDALRHPLYTFNTYVTPRWVLRLVKQRRL